MWFVKTLPRFGGIAFVALFLAGFAIAGDPGLDDGAKIATYFASHRDRVLIGYHVSALGLVCFLIWAWWLAGTAPQFAGDQRWGLAIMGTAIATIAVEFSVIACMMTLALISNQAVSPEVARTLVNLGQVFSCVDYFALAAFFLAVGVAVLETRMTSAWVAWTALALVPLSLVAAAPSLGLDLPVGSLTFIWVVAASVTFLRSPSNSVACVSRPVGSRTA